MEFHETKLIEGFHPYRLDKELAEGSMSVIYEGTHLNTGQSVIIKVPSMITRWTGMEPDIIENVEDLRFEAQFLRRSNLIGISGVVTLLSDRTDDLIPFIALAKLGDSLADMIEADQQFDLKESLALLRDVAHTIEALHSHGMFHYDIKPGNILWSDTSWKLIDPCSQEKNTEEYYENRYSRGTDRDVLALGRTFISMYVGHEGEVHFPTGYGYEVEDYPELLNLLNRMVGHSRYSVTSATDVRRKAGRILRMLEQWGQPDRADMLLALF